MRSTHNAERGHTLVVVMSVLALSMVLTLGMAELSASSSRTRQAVTRQASDYYEVEETVGRIVTWLQQNSKSLVTAFTSSNFNANFDLGQPSAGANEAPNFAVPTMVKMKGTNNSVMLSNNEFFGTSSFPNTTHIDNGTPFNAIQSFQDADLGGANARVVLTWARETDGSFEPIFRIDVMTGNNPDRGVHSWSYVYSTLVSSAGAVGFYGRDFLTLQTPNNNCVSYQYTRNGSSWSRGAPRANCPIASNGMINISSKVHGTAKALPNPGVSLNPPGGEVSNGVCEGAGCHSFTLPSFNSWAEYCPTHSGDLTISSNTTLPAGGCWRDITISNNRTLTLTDTTEPYYIRSINYNGNNAALAFGSIPEGQRVTLYTEALNSNNHINGNKLFNMDNAPHQVLINYLGTETLRFNGTAQMNAVVVAPYASIIVNGNFNFYGGIWAKDLTVSGNATISYDEALGGASVVNDLNFAVRKTSQRYR